MVDTITNSTPTPTTAPNNATTTSEDAIQDSTRRSISTLSENFDNFLTLLTTQLQNQDPTEPMEPAEFTNQLAIFSQVEQGVQTNEKLDQLISLNGNLDVLSTTNDKLDGLLEQGQNATDLLGTLAELQQLVGVSQLSNSTIQYLGKNILAAGNTTQLKDGQATFEYDIGDDASEIDITIRNANGSVVHTDLLKLTNGKSFERGRLNYEWDGFNDEFGVQMADGTYEISVAARDAEGGPIPVQTYARGQVTGVNFYNDELTLLVGNTEYPISSVFGVTDGTANALPNNAS